MKIRLIAIGEKPPSWIATGITTYQKRLDKHLNFEIISLKTPKGNNTKQQEGKLLLQASKDCTLRIALDEFGKQQTSEQFSQTLSRWQLDGHSVSLLIGGAEGLSQECLSECQQKWSLSQLTLPHMLARLLVVEQLYRAQSLLAGHPYHKP